MKKITSTPNVPAAIGPHNQAIAFGGMLITPSQLGPDSRSSAFVSKDVSAQTKQVFRNLKAILDGAGFTFDQVVKTTRFLTDMGDFVVMNAVYEKHFSGAFPARSAITVKTLPKGGLVEIEVITHR